MFRITILLLNLFWLSCGTAPHNKQNKTTAIVKKIDTLQTEIDVTDSVEIKKDSISKEVKEEASLSIEKPETIAEKIIILPNHSKWNKLLTTYVDDKGNVDYKGFQNDSSELSHYLDYLARKSPEKDWSKNEKLAYYINLYNAATVKLILDNYPTKSIKDIKNPWGKSWVKTGDGLLSLGDIEHKILRKMNEPRIHFAINCASFSCPKLLNTAFVAELMESQLQTVTLDFINDKTRNVISNKKMNLSNIFKWYKKDFTENGSLSDYIKPYTEFEINENTAIEYLKYDWSLNEAK